MTSGLLVLMIVVPVQLGQLPAIRPAVLEPLTVTAGPFETALEDSFQSVAVITREHIERAPAASLAEVLATAAGVDIRRRGAVGVQADIGIRGTAYEQTLLMIDGIPLRDVQTGHHNMNLPVPLEHIERIEIIKGPGAMVFGGQATGGVINIVTRDDDSVRRAARLRVGRYQFAEGAGSLGFAGAASGHRISAEAQRSDGHLSDQPTDFTAARAHYTGRSRSDHVSLFWGLGIDDRDFGAFKFYTADFPDQREQTRTRLAYGGAELPLGDWRLDVRSWWRGHEDWFRTQVGSAAFINEHETRIAGISASASRQWDQGRSILGLNQQRQRIDSNALGQDRRLERSVWLAHRQTLSKTLAAEAGLTLIDYRDDGRFWLPSVGIRYRPANAWTLFAASARSVRLPSYTELNLVSGGNVGNPALEVERSQFHEVGARTALDRHRIELALFDRRTRNLIDWARQPGEVTWRAANFDGHRTRGGQIQWRWLAPGPTWLEAISLSHVRLNTRLENDGRQIKYALDFARQASSLNAVLVAGERTRLSGELRHVRRNSGQSSLLAAARLSIERGDIEWFVEGNNLLDREVAEAGFAPLPGRWLFAGIAWRR